MLNRNTNYILLSIALDIFSTLAAVALAIVLRSQLPYGLYIQSVPDNMRILYLQAGMVYPLVFLLFSLYDPDRTFRLADEYQILFRATLIAGLALAGVVYFTARDISRLSLVYFFSVHIVLIFSWRFVVRSFRNNGNSRNIRKVLLIGGGETARQVLDRLHDLSWAGVHLLGYLTDSDPIPEMDEIVPRLGVLAQTGEVVVDKQVDDVLVALPAESYNKVQELVARLIDKPCNTWVIPDYFSLLLFGSKVEDLGGVPMINLKAPSLTGYQRVVKRAFDIGLGLALFIPFIPVFGLIALAIKLDSPGPVIFKQQRVGENGKLFWMYKFRSMVSGADKYLLKFLQRDDNGYLIHKLSNDPRITRVGKFLRRTSLDELPQILNVLKGEMSLVGPRPELPLLVADYKPWQHKRFAVPQGITGWWQVNGRSEKPMHLHTEDDIYYVQNYSLLLDLQILLKTVLVVLTGKGAF